MSANGPQAPPSFALFLTEGQRAMLEGMTLPAARPLLRRAPRGDGHSVLVLPGFTAGDGSTGQIRRYLREQGHWAHGWRQGLNLGPSAEMRDALASRVDELAERSGRKVSLVGWSLGGVYARELAKRMPDRVRGVVTLGSPFADAGRASNVSRLFDWVAGGRRQPVDRRGVASHLREPPPMPSTAIFTRADGVVHWKACLEPERPHTENIEVPGSHTGLGFNALALYVLADRLSQPEGEWAPFDRTGWRRLLYGAPRA